MRMAALSEEGGGCQGSGERLVQRLFTMEEMESMENDRLLDG
jgi:hypothetical protein